MEYIAYGTPYDSIYFCLCLNTVWNTDYTVQGHYFNMKRKYLSYSGSSPTSVNNIFTYIHPRNIEPIAIPRLRNAWRSYMRFFVVAYIVCLCALFYCSQWAVSRYIFWFRVWSQTIQNHEGTTINLNYQGYVHYSSK